MSNSDGSWEYFNKNTRRRPWRELLRRAVGLSELSGVTVGTAVDLGCGSGSDSLALLRRGWTVHAVDSDGIGLEMLGKDAPAELRSHLHLHNIPFERFDFPPCHLVWASHSIPYCPRSTWPPLWDSICAALFPGGRFAGDFFGTEHGFAGRANVMLQTETEVRERLSGLIIESFEIEEGLRPNGNHITKWHAFGVIARTHSDES